MQPRLKQFYEESVRPELMKEKGFGNLHEVPRLEKVVLNTGVKVSTDRSVVEDAARDLGLVAGQKAVVTKARKSISNFKLREGMPIGAKVTLRGARMWEFVYRCLNIALPNIRDFRGVSNKLDGRGNYNLGIADHSIFPEIRTDGTKRLMGMDITFVTTTTDDELAHELLRRLGMPFRKASTAEGPGEAAA